VNDSNVNSATNKFIEILKHEENNCSLEKKISSKTKKLNLGQQLQLFYQFVVEINYI